MQKPRNPASASENICGQKRQRYVNLRERQICKLSREHDNLCAHYPSASQEKCHSKSHACELPLISVRPSWFPAVPENKVGLFGKIPNPNSLTPKFEIPKPLNQKSLNPKPQTLRLKRTLQLRSGALSGQGTRGDGNVRGMYTLFGRGVGPGYIHICIVHIRRHIIWTHGCIYTYVCIRTHTYMTDILTYLYTCIPTYIHTWIHICASTSYILRIGG